MKSVPIHIAILLFFQTFFFSTKDVLLNYYLFDKAGEVAHLLVHFPTASNKWARLAGSEPATQGSIPMWEAGIQTAHLSSVTSQGAR